MLIFNSLKLFEGPCLPDPVDVRDGRYVNRCTQYFAESQQPSIARLALLRSALEICGNHSVFMAVMESIQPSSKNAYRHKGCVVIVPYGKNGSK